MAAKKTKKSGTKKGTKGARAKRSTKAKATKPAKAKATKPAKAKAAKKSKAKSAKPKAAKTAKKTDAKPKRLSAIDAAAEVLRKSKEPMRSRELIAAMQEQGLWTSPGGKTPHATLYAAMIREISAKGKDARFAKTDRGLFASTAAGKKGA